MQAEGREQDGEIGHGRHPRPCPGGATSPFAPRPGAGTRAAAGDAVTSLADDNEAALVANVAGARAAVAELRAAAEAGGTGFDARAARQQLHGFRVENFGQVAAILHQVEDLTPAAAAGDPEAQAFLARARAGALAIGVTSAKAEVRAVKALVAAAEAELAPVEPVTEQPAV